MAFDVSPAGDRAKLSTTLAQPWSGQLGSEQAERAAVAEQDIDFHGSLDGFGFSWSWRYIALFSDWSQSDLGDLALVVSFRPFQE